MYRWIIITIISFVASSDAYAQYFGRNKPRYRSFDFKVTETPHFQINNYLNNDTLLSDLSKIAEQWYINHRMVFKQDIDFKIPVILYNDHAEFQQTNTISGEIGIGTGGVTEALKSRIVMPLTYSFQNNRHVLIHELVHAFQYNSILTNDSTSFQNLVNTPLWMVEGMAEYLSIGRADPFTSMWMRDALLNDNLPEISKLNNNTYFPYRYGQSIIAFLGGYFGDDKLNTLFINTAKYGLESGFAATYGQDTKTISSLWHTALKQQYSGLIQDRKEQPPGKKLLSDNNAGRINVSPSISPNGKYVVFLSEKDLFNTDVYLADANNGTILNKVTSFSRSENLDYINLMESSGTWSPDSKKFVIVGVKEGKNVLVVKDVLTGKTIKTIAPASLDAFINPVYHPNGKEIIVTGIVNGQVDLYAIQEKSGKIRQLTHDMYSENMANFSPDGSHLVFTYDRTSILDGGSSGKYTRDLAVMDYATGIITVYDTFHGVDNLNPVYDYQNNIYFVSEKDGLRNLFKLETASGKILQMTDLLTGISGISAESPMISASHKNDKLTYTHYYNGEYTVYQANSGQLLNLPVSDTFNINQQWGTLPASKPQVADIVQKNINHANDDFRNIIISTSTSPYKSKFKLDYIGGGTGIVTGVSNNSFRNATGLQGGVEMLFSDLLSNNQLYTQVSLNGEILDMGGIVSYINRKNRLAWGVGLSHVPLRLGYQQYYNDQVTINGVDYPAIRESTNLIRIFDQSLSLFAHYPFSTILRLEGGIGGTWRSFRWDEYNDYYIGNQYQGYQYVGSEKNKIPTGDALQIDQYYTIANGPGANANIALVGDNSYFGVTSPLAGHRYRISLEQFMGSDKYTGLLMDGRKYFWVKPVSFAFRGLSYFRWEQHTQSVYPVFLGNMGFVRGIGSVLNFNLEETGLTYSQVLGSKLAMGSFEIRLPFTGPKRLSLISSSFFLSDISLFIDSGVTFDNFRDWKDGKLIDVISRDEHGNIILDSNHNPVYEIKNALPAVVTSAGISLRINLFGALILEPYYARTLSRGDKFRFGLNLIPGW